MKKNEHVVYKSNDDIHVPVYQQMKWNKMNLKKNVKEQSFNNNKYNVHSRKRIKSDK